jgi:hypothetical protein
MRRLRPIPFACNVSLEMGRRPGRGRLPLTKQLLVESLDLSLGEE